MGPKKRPRSTEKSSDNPDDPESSNVCKGCNKVFKSVRTHLLRSKTNCIKQYTDSEHETLENESQAKKRRTDAENSASKIVLIILWQSYESRLHQLSSLE